jgi:hypothetical protein
MNNFFSLFSLACALSLLPVLMSSSSLFNSRIMVSSYEVPAMCTWINFAIRQPRARQLLVQCGIYGCRRRALLSLPTRNLQARQWISPLYQLRAWKVLDRDRDDVRGNVQRLPDAYLLEGGEQQDRQLHVQQGLYGGGRGDVYGMRDGHFQRREWVGSLLAMPGWQVLYCGRGSICCCVRRRSF